MPKARLRCQEDSETDPLVAGGETGDSDGQALLRGGSSSRSSSEELSSVRSITSTFLLLSLDDRFCSCVSVLDESRDRESSGGVHGSVAGELCDVHTAVYAVVGRGHLLHFFLGPHGRPASILFELDFITVRTAVEDFHEQPATTRTT